ncbi:S-layer homology domain-containing protein [Indiicoccus explosivorum]|uniref:S-layer homology domain-containing protein n=1 Tax=Indiicoccus explosivorum TaxID=1917864 RepID=UPI000B43DD93|nr:S-layer homology domain-containing protein [Indiicoccus explosivorum]
MKKLLGAGLALLLSLSVLSPVQAASDLKEGEGFYDEMTYLIEQEVLTGFPDGTYRPDRLVTRAEAAIMIGRILGFEGGMAETDFPDVYSSMKASGYIAQGAEAGIINGFEDGTFRPDAPVTRGDMAIFVARAFDLQSAFALPFSDVGPNMNAADSIAAIFMQFITAGYSDNTYRPLQEITRGQLSAFLARALEPRFKNEAKMTGSFIPDMTKAYTFDTQYGTLVSTYEFASPFPEAFSETFMWVSRGYGDDNYYLLAESPEKMIVAYPASEYYTELAYPIREGKTFIVYNSGEEFIHRYTDINATVETPYKTFTDAVEVTSPGGHLSYYVRGHGFVKGIAPDGTVTSQLVNVE